MGQINKATILLKRSVLNLNAGFAIRMNMANTSSENYDVVVVGGGIIGIATAREMQQRHPQLRMAVVEKENKLGSHQTEHNSGVVHAGIYYLPGSLKAKLCVEGMKLSYDYFDKNKVPYKKVGKLIVATNDVEMVQLNTLYERALQNQVPGVQFLDDSNKIRNIEPYCVGKKAIWSPETGIVDYAVVNDYFARDFKNLGGKIYLEYETIAFEKNTNTDYPVRVISRVGEHVNARYVLTCAGLQSDLIAQKSGAVASPSIVPIRGEYLELHADRRHMIRGNIYPVPDSRFPFLGVHFTIRMNGDVWLGPNAVLAFRREGYKWSDFNMVEFLNLVRYPGFQRLAKKHMMFGISELLYSMFPRLQVRELQRFVPQLKAADIIPGSAGVRAQALDEKGQFLEDFYFDVGRNSDLGRRILHCRNVPSPGATSALAIAKMIAIRVKDEFQLE